MSALSTLNSSRFNRASRICEIVASQQEDRAINPRLVRRLARTLITAGVKASPDMKRAARYGVKRHSQPRRREQ
jgi:hypothetical protein